MTLLSATGQLLKKTILGQADLCGGDKEIIGSFGTYQLCAGWNLNKVTVEL
jgi:hypothetical protein